MNYLSGFNIGSSGVDLFFILSGFIMFYITQTREQSPLKFIQARIVRIIPLYWALSFGAMMFFLIAPQLVNSSGRTTSIIASLSLWPDGSKYLIRNGWTLSYEFFFYFVFMMLLAFNHLLKFIGLALIFSALILVGSFFSYQSVAFSFLTSTLLLEFVLGGAVYFVFRKLIFNVFLSACLIFIGMSTLIYQNIFGVYESFLGRFLYYGVSFFLITIGFLGFENILQKIQRHVVVIFVILGDISFSMYLVHPFTLALIFVGTKKLNPNLDADLFLLVAITFSIILSYFVFQCLEKPLTTLFKPRGL